MELVGGIAAEESEDGSGGEGDEEGGEEGAGGIELVVEGDEERKD